MNENKLDELLSTLFKTELEGKIREKLIEELDKLNLEELIREVVAEEFGELRPDIAEIAKKTCAAIVPEIVEDKAFSNELRSFLTEEISKDVNQKIADKNIDGMLEKNVFKFLNQQTPEAIFGNGKISHRLLDFSDFRISAQSVKGMFENFNSSGIEDQATQCQLTITDEFIAVENGLICTKVDIANRLSVLGDAEFKGNVNFSEHTINQLASKSVDKLFENKNEKFIFQVNKALEESYLNAKNLVVDGIPIVKEGSLSKNITRSNIQKLGRLQDLEVAGESILADTVHVIKGRLGVNTKSPNAALDVWDQDVEFVVKKAFKNTAYIGSERPHALIIGANNKNNLVLSPDGSVSIDDLNISSIKISVSPKEPQVAGKKGDIVFNSNPSENAPSGWQCLGGSRWLAFRWKP